jgi:hypothetical protein
MKRPGEPSTIVELPLASGATCPGSLGLCERKEHAAASGMACQAYTTHQFELPPEAFSYSLLEQHVLTI